MLIIGFTVDGFIQGVLVAGAAVFTNQLYKQTVNKGTVVLEDDEYTVEQE